MVKLNGHIVRKLPRALELLAKYNMVFADLLRLLQL